METNWTHLVTELANVTEEITAWHDRTWGDETSKPLIFVAAKVAEEAGEVLGAIIKTLEGRVDERAIYDEIGDVFIALAVCAHRSGLDLGVILARRWLGDVSRRTNPNR